MPIINYVREHIRFMEYATDEHLTASERLLWYALMHCMNMRAQGKVWPEEFIRISNERLLSYCPMKYDTMAAARNSLKQRGLIEFIKGDKNKQSPSYRIIYFYPEYAAPDTVSDGDYPTSIPEKSDYMGGNMGDNMGGNMGDNMGGNTGGNIGDYSINYKEKRKEYVYSDEKRTDDEEEELRARARADESGDLSPRLIERARAEAARSWLASFGRAATPQQLDGLAWRCAALGFGEGVLAEAIQRAALAGAASPFDYVNQLLSDWDGHNVRTVEDCGRYAAFYDASRGKRPGGMTVLEGLEGMNAMRSEG